MNDRERILDFIHSYKMIGVKNSFDFKVSKIESKNEKASSVLVDGLSHGVEFIKSLHYELDENRIKSDLKACLVDNIIHENQPFHIVFFVKGEKRNL
jgi:hypothetical protein